MRSLPSSMMTSRMFLTGKPMTFPGNPRLVVGGKKCSPRCAWFPGRITVSFSEIFSRWSLRWNAVYLGCFRRVYLRDYDNNAFVEKRTFLGCFIGLESIFRLAFTRNTFLDISLFIFNNHPFWFKLYRFLEIVYILGSEAERLALSWMQQPLYWICLWITKFIVIRSAANFLPHPNGLCSIIPQDLKGEVLLVPTEERCSTTIRARQGSFNKFCLALKVPC